MDRHASVLAHALRKPLRSYHPFGRRDICVNTFGPGCVYTLRVRSNGFICILLAPVCMVLLAQLPSSFKSCDTERLGLLRTEGHPRSDLCRVQAVLHVHFRDCILRASLCQSFWCHSAVRHSEQMAESGYCLCYSVDVIRDGACWFDTVRCAQNHSSAFDRGLFDVPDEASGVSFLLAPACDILLGVCDHLRHGSVWIPGLSSSALVFRWAWCCSGRHRLDSVVLRHPICSFWIASRRPGLRHY